MRREKTKLYEDRVEKFMERMNAGAALVDRVPLQATYFKTSEPVAWSERLQGDYQPIHQGDVWGGDWDCAWFHITGQVPAQWAGSKVVACLNLNGELCLFDDSGCPLYGMTAGSSFQANYASPFPKITRGATVFSRVSMRTRRDTATATSRPVESVSRIMNTNSRLNARPR